MGVEVPSTPTTAVQTAAAAAEAIRTLNHLTLGDARGCELDYPCDAYRVLSSLSLLAARLPQALTQIAGFLQGQLDRGLVVVDDGEHAGDPGAAIGRAVVEIGAHAIPAAHRLEDALTRTGAAIAWASSTEPATIP